MGEGEKDELTSTIKYRVKSFKLFIMSLFSKKIQQTVFHHTFVSVAFVVFCGGLLAQSQNIGWLRLMPNIHRRLRRDLTRRLSRVGVGGVYWAQPTSLIFVLGWSLIS